jgi:hypothetical protein
MLENSSLKVFELFSVLLCISIAPDKVTSTPSLMKRIKTRVGRVSKKQIKNIRKRNLKTYKQLLMLQKV